jgi:hypothetical protein
MARAFFVGLAYSYVIGYGLLAVALVFAARQIRQLTIYSDIAKTSEDLKQRNKEYDALNETNAKTTKELKETQAGYDAIKSQMAEMSKTMQASLDLFEPSRKALAESGVKAVADVAQQAVLTTEQVRTLIESFSKEKAKVDAARFEQLAALTERANTAQKQLAETVKENSALVNANTKLQAEMESHVKENKQLLGQLEKTKQAFEGVLSQMNSAANTTATNVTSASAIQKEASSALSALTTLITNTAHTIDALKPKGSAASTATTSSGSVAIAVS